METSKSIVEFPMDGSSLRAMFGAPNRRLSDELKVALPKALDEHPELRDLFNVTNDEDCQEGSCRDNYDEGVSVCRAFFKKNKDDFPLLAEATRERVRKAIYTLLKNNGIDWRTRRRIESHMAAE